MRGLHPIVIIGAAIIIGTGVGAVISNIEQRSSGSSAPSFTSAASTGRFTLCGGGSRTNCVIDGDTLWIDGVKIRVADIDTPEISEPKCASEMALGQKAKHRLLELANAGPFDMRLIGNRDEDQYGRKLRVLVRDGRSLGDQLVSEGLARTWGGRREPWC